MKKRKQQTSKMSIYQRMKNTGMIVMFYAMCIIPFGTLVFLLQEVSILNIIALIINIIACIVFFIYLRLEMRNNKNTDSSICIDTTEDNKNKVETKEETLMNIKQKIKKFIYIRIPATIFMISFGCYALVCFVSFGWI
ncbi:MAG: hypothetical protein IJD07_03770 [Clostridia bacterium]|nr:hypothetical protein [Clostridia bacterium]